MVDVDIYELDGIKYYLIDELEINNNNYLYLSNVDDEADFIFRKRDDNDEDLLHPLKDEREVKLVALVFANKMLEK